MSTRSAVRLGSTIAAGVVAGAVLVTTVIGAGVTSVMGQLEGNITALDVSDQTGTTVTEDQSIVVDADTGNRLLLKFAFVDMPLQRAFGAESHASEQLSTMLQDLATEREAAGRAVWSDTWRMLGRAPCPGALARLIGGLEHGDDGVRQAAAEGLLLLPERGAGIAGFAKERLPREPRPAVRALLEQLSS